MAEVTGEEGTPVPAPALTVSGSFREGSRSSARRRTLSGASNAPPAMRRGSFNADNEFMTLLHSSDPVKVELNRLENEVRDKNRELGEAQAEIKALRLSERLRVKAVEE